MTAALRGGLLAALIALAAPGLAGCGGEAIGTIRIRLRSPQALDPSQVAQVIIAVVHDSNKTCVSGPGSNTCVEIQSVEEATTTAGYVKQTNITPSTGSSATLEDLPEGPACFVAEAFNASSSPLGLGCAEVDLSLDKHTIEIELATK